MVVNLINQKMDNILARRKASAIRGGFRKTIPAMSNSPHK
jgi:hypothetical protein